MFDTAKFQTTGFKITFNENGLELARAYLYLLRNDLHKQPCGYIEDVFVDEKLRGRGIGTKLVREIIKTARDNGCYKLVGTSRNERPEVHKFYEKLGFKARGIEFRMSFGSNNVP